MDAATMAAYEHRASMAESRLDLLTAKLSKLVSGGGMGGEPPVALLESLRELRMSLGKARVEGEIVKQERDQAVKARDDLAKKNDKLAYQIVHLKRTVDDLTAGRPAPAGDPYLVTPVPKKGAAPAPPAANGKAAKPAAKPAAAPPAASGGVDAKKLAKCKKEGGKKAQDICGMCDMGGVYYYTLGMEECENNWELMQSCMDGANTPVAPDAEERKGGADHLGKMFMGFNDDELIIYTHVPKGEKTAALNAADWAKAVCGAEGVNGVVQPGADAVFAKASVKGDKANGRFPIKIKDLAISASISLLRSKQLLPDDEGSDDDVNYGEDLEW